MLFTVICPIQVTVMSCPNQLRCVRGVVSMDLKDQYMSIWYGLVCRCSFYRCPIKALTTMRTYAVALSYLSYIGVPTPEWMQCWSFMRSHCLLESNGSKRTLNSIVPPIPALDMCVVLTENRFFLLSSLFKKPLSKLRFVIGVLPSPILVRGSFSFRWCVRSFRTGTLPIFPWHMLHIDLRYSSSNGMFNDILCKE